MNNNSDIESVMRDVRSILVFLFKAQAHWPGLKQSFHLTLFNHPVIFHFVNLRYFWDTGMPSYLKDNRGSITDDKTVLKPRAIVEQLHRILSSPEFKATSR
jgi:hypothetical protein